MSSYASNGILADRILTNQPKFTKWFWAIMYTIAVLSTTKMCRFPYIDFHTRPPRFWWTDGENEIGVVNGILIKRISIFTSQATWIRRYAHSSIVSKFIEVKAFRCLRRRDLRKWVSPNEENLPQLLFKPLVFLATIKKYHKERMNY